MEKKERSRSRSPIIMKNVDESNANVIDGNEENTVIKQKEDYAEQESLPLKEELSNIDVQIAKRHQPITADENETDDSDEDDDIQLSDIDDGKPRADLLMNKQKCKPCLNVYVTNLPQFNVIKQCHRNIRCALKYKPIYFMPKNQTEQGFGSVLIQFAIRSDYEVAVRRMRKAMDPPIRIIKDIDMRISKKIEYRQRDLSEFQLNYKFNKTIANSEFRTFGTMNPKSQLNQESVTSKCAILDNMKNCKPVFVNPDPPVNDTFGLSVQYLKKIGIHLPLKNRVFVQNLIRQITEEKVREVFSLAGIIRCIKMVPKNLNPIYTHAVVEFEHPLEAVQAISMLDGRKLYGRPMKVSMDNIDCPKPLPLGLTSIGRGLGPNGQALRALHAALSMKPNTGALQQMGTLNDNQSLYNDMVSDAQNDQNNSKSYLNASNQPNFFNSRNSAFGAQQSGNNLQTAPSQNMQANPQKYNASLDPNTILSQFGFNMEQIIANMGQNVGQYMSNMLQNMSNMEPNMPNVGQNISNAGQNTPHMGQNMSNMGQNTPHVWQNMSNMAQNTPHIGQNIQNMGQNIQNLGQHMPNMEQPISDIGQTKSNFSQYPGNTNNFIPQTTTTFKVPSPKASPVVSNNMISSLEYGAKEQNPQSSLNFSSHNQDMPPKQKDNTTKKNTDVLEFSNLPHSVNTEVLNSKMRQIGEIIFGEMTGPGRAIVLFRNTIDAERCYKLFNNSKVDGQVIHVNYF